MRATLLIAAALLLSGCRTGRDVATGSADTMVPPTTPTGLPMAPPVGTGAMTTGLPMAPVAPAPDAPGREHRQYRKNLRAQPRTVPLFQGRAAVNAPLATSVVAAYKPKAPVVLADSGSSVQVATAAKNAQAAAGPGIVQTRTDVAAVPWWKRVLGYWPWLAAGAAVWLLWPAIMVLLRRLV
ncbi:hypothetical protein [Hymenobacter psychrophilus]|uniref:Uncharacterized protein n=1 Tax=Hymenobacter psychrophilus TaxID=651662 RepID=A0A1H3PJR1_9BACT|nr:hypothetical protein [Hymenobacter psychrophilus]SDZ01188.1 hypothetical protein SAMN04488069_1355 [Hymenobacter psychrophilus]